MSHDKTTKTRSFLLIDYDDELTHLDAKSKPQSQTKAKPQQHKAGSAPLRPQSAKSLSGEKPDFLQALSRSQMKLPFDSFSPSFPV